MRGALAGCWETGNERWLGPIDSFRVMDQFDLEIFPILLSFVVTKRQASNSSLRLRCKKLNWQNHITSRGIGIVFRGKPIAWAQVLSTARLHSRSPRHLWLLCLGLFIHSGARTHAHHVSKHIRQAPPAWVCLRFAGAH